jgi:hypothetical protein
MKLKFTVVFKRGLKTVGTIEGQRDVDANDLTLEEMVSNVPTVEAFLEKLTGLRVHVMSEPVE